MTYSVLRGTTITTTVHLCQEDNYILSLFCHFIRAQNLCQQVMYQHAKDCEFLTWILSTLSASQLKVKHVSVMQCQCVIRCWQTENTEEHVQLVEAKSLVKHILERVNEAVRDRENSRRTMDMNCKLDKRLLETTNDAVLAEYKVCYCLMTLHSYFYGNLYMII